MRNEIHEMVLKIGKFRSEFFGKDENVYRLLGRAMGNLIEVRDNLPREE